MLYLSAYISQEPEAIADVSVKSVVVTYEPSVAVKMATPPFPSIILPTSEELNEPEPSVNVPSPTADGVNVTAGAVLYLV